MDFIFYFSLSLLFFIKWSKRLLHRICSPVKSQTVETVNFIKHLSVCSISTRCPLIFEVWLENAFWSAACLGRYTVTVYHTLCFTDFVEEDCLVYSSSKYTYSTAAPKGNFHAHYLSISIFCLFIFPYHYILEANIVFSTSLLVTLQIAHCIKESRTFLKWFQ